MPACETCGVWDGHSMSCKRDDLTKDETALIEWHEKMCETHRGRTQDVLFDELGVDHIISGISVVRAEERVEHWGNTLGKTPNQCWGALWRDGFIAGMIYQQERT